MPTFPTPIQYSFGNLAKAIRQEQEIKGRRFQDGN
jgi:hypothetical protein